MPSIHENHFQLPATNIRDAAPYAFKRILWKICIFCWFLIQIFNLYIFRTQCGTYICWIGIKVSKTLILWEHFFQKEYTGCNRKSCGKKLLQFKWHATLWQLFYVADTFLQKKFFKFSLKISTGHWKNNIIQKFLVTIWGVFNSQLQIISKLFRKNLKRFYWILCWSIIF